VNKKIVIIGSGASGISAALGFEKKGIVPTILDVGDTNKKTCNVSGNLYDYRKNNELFDLMIGENLEGLSNILNGTSLPPKLTSPMNNYIISDHKEHSPLKTSNFSAIQSFAIGGLAAAWGAGLYRYNESELQNMPLRSASLNPFYDALSKEIGISGQNDDLAPFFGNDDTLLPPVRLSGKAEYLYKKYSKKRDKFNKNGIFIGYPRIGVLTKNHKGRDKCNYSNFETWLSDIPWVYNPAQSLNRLIKEDKVIYRKGIYVESWNRKNGKIIINGKNISDNSPFKTTTDNLIIATGTLNSAKLILSSKKDTLTKLPILDNPLLQIPVFLPSFLGSPIDKSAFGMTNLNLIFKSPENGTTLQGSIIELTSPPRSVFFEKFPASSVMNLKLIKMISTSLLAMFLYYPSSKNDAGSIRLNKNNELEIVQKNLILDKQPVKKIVNALFGMGALTHPLIIEQSMQGYAIHYAGTIPMKSKTTSDYESSPDGELHGESGIYIVDGSSFSHISSKNLSFTIMANSMRIADKISDKVRRN